MLSDNVFFSSFSVPDVIVSDNASCFVSREFSKFCFKWGIRHVTTTPYYPQPSHVERFNRNLKAALIAYHADAQDRWDQLLILRRMNQRIRRPSRHCSPFERAHRWLTDGAFKSCCRIKCQPVPFVASGKRYGNSCRQLTRRSPGSIMQGVSRASLR